MGNVISENMVSPLAASGAEFGSFESEAVKNANGVGKFKGVGSILISHLYGCGRRSTDADKVHIDTKSSADNAPACQRK